MSKIEEWKAAQNRFAKAAEYVGFFGGDRCVEASKVSLETVLSPKLGPDAYYRCREFDVAMGKMIRTKFEALAGEVLAMLADEAEAARLAAREEASALMVEIHRPA